MTDSADSAVPPNREAGRPPRTDWQEPFLDSFRLLGIQSQAARLAHVSADTVKRERTRNPSFADAYLDAEQEANGSLERFLHERATVGQPVKKTVTKTSADGAVEVTVTETLYVSTAALLALARARMPERYSPPTRLEHTGADGGAIQVHSLSRLDQEIEQLTRELEQRGRALPAVEDAPVEVEERAAA